MTTTILRIDSSPRHEASRSRELTAAIVESLRGEGEARTQVSVIHRDVSEGLPVVSEAWTSGAYIDPSDRTPEQRAALEISDTVVDEIKEADIVVIGAPMYNFTVSAALKSWVDQVARVGLTFKYTETGPVGLLENKRAIVAIATGGVPQGSEHDLLTPYMTHFLGFLGITDVTFIAADGLMGEGAEKAIKAAHKKIDELEPA